jgi:PAS domain S-box-containing protein
VSTTRPDAASGEARAERQRRQLQRVADALSWSLEPRAVATQLLEAACRALGAPRGWVATRSDDGREVAILAQQGFDPASMEPLLRVPIDLDVPVTTVLRTGRAIHHASAEDREREYPALRHGGANRYTQASVVVPMVFEGTTLGALAVAFDDIRTISASDRWFLEALAAHGAGALERARLFEAVRVRDHRLKLALESSGTWIWSWDLEAERVTWVPEPPGSLSVAGPDVAPDTWLDAVHPDDRARVRAALDTYLLGGDNHEVEFRVSLPGQPERWMAATGNRLEDATGPTGTVIGTLRDITERKLADLERDRRLEAEREAARLREAFVGVVSHELRTPITTIFGGTRVLARRWREMDAEARDALLSDVSSESDRLFRMVEDLLVITRVERGSLEVGDEPVFLRPIVERVVASERSRSPDVTFEARIPPDLPSAEGEEMFVEQVLRNLLTNAAKYGGAGSRVAIEAEATADAVTLRVLDEGPGILEEEVEQLFQLFYRSPSTAPRASGAGIGLFVCRQLVVAMGGSISARNRAQGGAVFEMALRRYGDDGDA